MKKVVKSRITKIMTALTIIAFVLPAIGKVWGFDEIADETSKSLSLLINGVYFSLFTK